MPTLARSLVLFCLFCFIPFILPSWPIGTTNWRFPKCHFPISMYCPSLLTTFAFRNIYAISLSDSREEKGLGSWPLVMEQGWTGFLQTLMLQKYLVCTSERTWKNWSQLHSSTALLKAFSRTPPIILCIYPCSLCSGFIGIFSSQKHHSHSCLKSFVPTKPAA